MHTYLLDEVSSLPYSSHYDKTLSIWTKFRKFLSLGESWTICLKRLKEHIISMMVIYLNGLGKLRWSHCKAKICVKDNRGGGGVVQSQQSLSATILIMGVICLVIRKAKKLKKQKWVLFWNTLYLSNTLETSLNCHWNNH